MTATATGPAGQLKLATEPDTISRTFSTDGSSLRQVLAVPHGTFESNVPSVRDPEDLLGSWWRSYFAGERVTAQLSHGEVRTLELFCGPGGFACGFSRAAAELGLRMSAVGAVDSDADALAVYRANHRPQLTCEKSVSTLIDYQVRGSGDVARFVYPPEIVVSPWDELVGTIDVVLAGPPCQGHSNLNNRTRRIDPRNELYLTVPAIAVALEAPVVVIENVPAVVHDQRNVVATTEHLLREAGYAVECGTLQAAQLGWPQRRNRFFLIARKDRAPLPLSAVAAALADEPRTVMWAIGDLADVEDDLISEPIQLSAENRRRIDWLFDNDEYDLPLTERPDCHQEGTSYMAVYGRLHPDRPAPTITTGFMTPGRGRFIHPTRRRVLTAREAARLQGFPDDYAFRTQACPTPSKRQLAKWIGDAVPLPLGYAAGLSALAIGWP